MWVGSLDTLNQRIGPDSVCVPQYMYKVMYRPSDSTYKCYIFPNSVTATEPLENYVVDMQTFNRRTGVRFRKGKAFAAFMRSAREAQE